MHYEMIQTISDVCKHDGSACSSPNIYTEVELLYCYPHHVFLTIFHSHDYNKE